MRTRREPPRFRKVEVLRVERRSPRLVHVTLGGTALAGFPEHEPAASVRLLLPPSGSDELILPRWTGNLWHLPDGTPATIRTLTPLAASPEKDALAIEIVLHGSGAAATWAEHAGPGIATAVSGPGRGYTIDPEATALVLAGDETAVPAITDLLEHLPSAVPAHVHVEVDDPDARVPLPDRSETEVRWHERPPHATRGDALLAAIRDERLAAGTRLWAAGEAAAMQRIRRHLFEERDVPRPHTHVRGYWKHGRSGEDAEDA